MADEIFDIVDESDEVIGQRPRSEVHRHMLRHRAVHVLVFNARGQVFLQKRSMSKDCHPGVWDSSTSGHLDSGEEYDACAVRELQEEIGLKVSGATQRLFKIDACEQTGMEFVWVYRCEAEGPFTLHPEEISEGAWFACRDVDRWVENAPSDFAPAFAMIWRMLTARRG